MPQRLREPVARVLNVSKQQQVWLQKSTGTKHKAEATRLAPAIMAEFAKTLTEAEGLLAQRPLRTTLTQQEIDRIAEWHYATVLATDEAFTVEGATEEEAFTRSIADQLTEAGVEFGMAHPLGPSAAFGLSDRQLAQRAAHLDDWLPLMRGALARGDISMVSETMTELLDRAQLNLDPQSAAFRKLGLAVLRADVRAWEAVERRAKGEPIETPVVEELTAPKGPSAPMGSKGEPNLQVAFEGWQKEGGRTSSTVSEYQRALDLFTQLHGNLPVVEIRKQHALQFRQALQEVPRGKSKTLAKLTLPELVDWRRAHPSVPSLTPATVNKLLGGVQAIAQWAIKNGLVPEDTRDAFAGMKLQIDEGAVDPSSPRSCIGSLPARSSPRARGRLDVRATLRSGFRSWRCSLAVAALS